MACPLVMDKGDDL